MEDKCGCWKDDFWAYEPFLSVDGVNGMPKFVFDELGVLEKVWLE